MRERLDLWGAVTIPEREERSVLGKDLYTAQVEEVKLHAHFRNVKLRRQVGIGLSLLVSTR